jgi:ComF family protein
MFDAIVPAPLHAAWQRVRGYNHAGRLVRVVGAALGIPVRTDLLRRVRATRPQVGLDGEKRRNNLAGAFRANSKAVDGLTVLLIDDVSTTGATLRECAKTLKLAGARVVYGLSLGAG